MNYTIPSNVRIGLDIDWVLAGFMNAFVRRAKEMGVDFTVLSRAREEQ